MNKTETPKQNREPDYLDELIEDAKATRPGFAALWEPDAVMLRLSSERARLGLSQAQVAERMGVPRLAVVRLENNPSSVAFSRVLAYAQAIGAEILVKPSKEKPTRATAGPGRPVKAARSSNAAVL